MGLENSIADVVVEVFRINLATLIVAGLALYTLKYIGDRLGFFKAGK